MFSLSIYRFDLVPALIVSGTFLISFLMIWSY